MKKIELKAKMFFGILLFSALLFVLNPASTHAAEIQNIQETYINPLYEDIITKGDLVKPEPDTEVRTFSTPQYQTDKNIICDEIREAMKDREANVTVYYKTTDTYSKPMVVDLVENALKETNVPDEGDYIRWQYYQWESNTSYFSSQQYYYYSITYSFIYYTTAKEEATVTTEVDAALDDMQFTADTTECEIIKSIYDYITSTVEYDDTDYGNDTDNFRKHTAYAAINNKTAVCQGYALLFYRMLREEDIGVRIIIGDSGGPHAWNIVQIDQFYYNADSTWDSSYQAGVSYRWFLKNMSDFSNHTRNEEYTTTAFEQAYPMSTESYTHTHQWGPGVITRQATCLADGKKQTICSSCGEIKVVTIPKLSHLWDTGVVTRNATYTSTGIKTYICKLCGTKKTETIATIPMPSISTTLTDQTSKANYIVIRKGSTVAYKGTTNTKASSLTIPTKVNISGITYQVTSISNKAFKNNKKLKKVVIPNGMTIIGKETFSGCKNLKTITIKSKSIKSVGKNAFKNINKKATIKVPKSKLKAYKKLFQKAKIEKTVKIKK